MEENGRIDMSRPTVEMKNIVKMFGSFKANDGINLTVHRAKYTPYWAKTARANPRL